jgi:TadE-like protein
MRARRPATLRRASGQALLETILIMPLMLLIVLNVVNFGYFFIVALNLAAAPRSGVEYSILGFATPTSLSLPDAGPPTAATSVSHLGQQDLTGAISAPTGATIQVCSSTVGMALSGATLCKSCTGTSCGNAITGSPAPDPDPESPSFTLNRVDVTYTFSPPIPGTPFGLALLPISVCTSSGGTVTCTFHHQVSMRAMN